MSKKKDKKNVNDKLSELFDVPNDVENLPAEIDTAKSQAVAVMEDTEEEVKLEQDFEHSRQTIHKLIAHGEDAILEYMQLVTESESPRAYEVLAKLLDAVANLSKDNVELHNMKKTIKDKMNQLPAQGGSAMNIKNANIIVGTTADLQKQIKNESTSDQSEDPQKS